MLVVGQLYQLVMGGGQGLVKECCHLTSPYAAAGEYWVLSGKVPGGSVPGMVGRGGATPGLTQDTPVPAQGGDLSIPEEYLMGCWSWAVEGWSGRWVVE